jgi:uncharacterized protein with von Willebrand factor type A (vWA) domain
VSAGLLDRSLGLVHALRAAGVPVSVAETLDAASAMAAVDLLDRDGLRAALAATLLKRPAHRPAFDALFDLWFPPLVGEPGAADQVDVSGGASAEPPGEDGDLREEFRARLLDALLDGDDTAVARLAREAVAAFGRAESRPGRQSFFGYRVLRAVSPDTLVAALIAGLLGGGGTERTTFTEEVARVSAGERVRAFEQAVEGEIRRRLAEEKGAEQVAATAVRPLVDQVDFLRASRDDLLALRRQVYPLARRLATRLAAQRRSGRSGRLDVRRTVRASLGSGGVPITTHHRPRRPHKPELVVLCDLSGSVASFAHFTLLLTWALKEQFTRVRAFGFIDTTDEVTRFLDRAEDLPDALARMAREAELVWFDGHSDYGHAFEVFAERYADVITPRTSLLVLGDGRTNYRSPALPVLRRMAGEARHAYWLNPEPRGLWGSGDSSALAYAEVMDMVECRTVAQLEHFVTHHLSG